jgi:hypothetical protein
VVGLFFFFDISTESLAARGAGGSHRQGQCVAGDAFGVGRGIWTLERSTTKDTKVAKEVREGAL